MSVGVGRHIARPIGAALGFTDNGTEQVAIEFRLEEGDYTGETITAYLYFKTDKSIDISMKALRVCGWTGDDLSDFAGETMPAGFGERDVALVCEEETYDGKTRVKVKWINDPNGGLALKNRMDPAQAKAFAARLKGAAVASRSQTSGAGSSSGAGRPTAQPQRQPTGGASTRGAASRYGSSGHGANAKHTGTPDPDFGDDEIPF